jgi:hypothetical protein
MTQVIKVGMKLLSKLDLRHRDKPHGIPIAFEPTNESLYEQFY